MNYNEDAPQIEFNGSVTSFIVSSVAPERDNSSSGGTQFGSSLNRLNISVQVNYANAEDDEDAWTQNFSFFQDFSNEERLENVQDELIQAIFEQITTDIFNKAFTNW